MKLLFILTLMFLITSVHAGYRVVKMCDENYNCQYIKVYDNQNNQTNQSNDALIDAIGNSGSKNMDTINRGWNPQYYPNYQNY